MRRSILTNQPRIDGRDTDTVRPIFIETDVLPSAHGSSLFTRGETQAIVVATLVHQEMLKESKQLRVKALITLCCITIFQHIVLAR